METEKGTDDSQGKAEVRGAFPIACLGGSAGGLRPYTEVIGEIPADSGIAVVVVNHSRRSQTRLPQILARSTSMPVRTITEGMRPEPNCVYIIPPDCDLTMKDGAFELSQLSKRKGWPTVITVFLESLAHEWKGKAIAVILSGLDSDGATALRSIKAAGGITFAQKVVTAEHPDMPVRAIETGCVDYELTPPEIGRELGRIGLQSSGAGLPEKPRGQFPIVGVGASAGGLEAFTSLLEHLPRNTGMAFVLVQHLDPKHASQLTEILSRTSKMPVLEVHGAVAVEPDHVYVTPPDRNLTIVNGVLETVPRPETSARNLPVDAFLQALAKDRQNLAFGVILSGTASDGTWGVRAIKAEGGITFAQEPASAKFDGMPRNAIASGAIDFVLDSEGIAKQLVVLSQHPYLQNLQSAPELAPDSRSLDPQDMDQVFVRLRTATGIDFANYKQNTILRRIKRRMAVHGVGDLKGYVRLLDQKNGEAGILAQDFLINVTSFFREPEVHQKLQEIVFPALLEGRTADDPIRIWIPGCSTGEEAYSLAMGIVEFLEKANVRPEVQVFASDINEALIDKARAGIYTENGLRGVSPERLERFFVRRNRSYQVSQAIRDLCVFARQDVTRDPPFSKMDLVSCCNLLIYLGPVLQKKALSSLHYALKPNGFLVLGSSESIGPFGDLFETIDRKYRIFARKAIASRPMFDLLSFNSQAGTATMPRAAGEHNNPAMSIQKEAERMLLADYAPASVIVDESMHMLQSRGRIDHYLQIPQGAPTTNLRLMVRPGLLAGLKSAVGQALKENVAAAEKGLRMKEGGGFRLVDLRVSPIRSAAGKDRCFLVLFEDAPEKPAARGSGPDTKRSRGAKVETAGAKDHLAVERLQQEIARLEHELTETRDYLQSIIETQETSAEELRSSMEEAQATNEELDTAKEELQASNEELNTVNDELRIRNAEQTSLNSDLRKLLENINVPLVMVGKDLRIRWFTPAIEPFLNLLPTDQGRAITDLRSTTVPDFVQMLVRAMAGSEEKSVEFQHRNGGWLSLRILPYKGPDKTIDGAIATLIDVDELKRALDFAEAVVATAREPLVVLDADLRVKTANDAFYEIFHLEKRETEGRRFYDVGRGEWNISQIRRLLEDILPKDSAIKNFEFERHSKQEGSKTMLLNAREIRQHDGLRMILLAIDDITELRRSTEDLRRRNDDLKQFVFAASHDLQEPLRMIVAHTQLLAARYGDKLDKKGRESTQYAVEGALRMEALISGLREFWQLSEQGEQQREPVDCNKVLKQASLNLEAAIAASNATVTGDPLPTLMASEATLIQLFQNLIGNALKYRSAEPPAIHVSATREGAEWIFSVRDNGIGIDPKDAGRIFGVFKRLHAPNRYPGTGMGLAICQKIVERHGGRIWVESHTGGGSNFKFALPA